MTNENQAKSRASRTEDTSLLRHSEIRNGEFVRYYGKSNEITSPDSVTVISEDAFRNNKHLTHVRLGKSVTLIENGAFSGCSNLQSVTLPEGLYEIGNSVFFGCEALTEIAFTATDGWYYTYDPNAESGGAADLTDPEDNADLLREDYRAYYVKRTPPSEDTPEA